MTRRTKKPRRDIYADVTDRMVESLEAGTVPWRRTWKGGSNGLPRNARTGKSYRGINVVTLWLTAQDRNYSTSEWMTFKQAKTRGGNVRKGEKGTQIVFWKMFGDKDDKDSQRWMLRTYTVFNLDQCENLDDDAPEPAEYTDADALSDAYLSGEGIPVVAGNPAYSPTDDVIRMPAADRFDSNAEYHSTLFHEMTHSTGSKKRLDRLTESFAFGDHNYSKEELVAEMGAAFLCAITGIEDKRLHDNSAAYLQHWVLALKGDPKLVVSAAQQAQKAVDRVVSHSAVAVESEAA